MDPESAFALLGNATRLDIVRALGEAGEPVSFSELRERVGVRDSGQFNYHLGKLVGSFVADGDDGYGLRHTGLLVYGAVLAGTFTGQAGATEALTIPIEDPCPDCGGAIEATYSDERMTVTCTACGEQFGAATVPPGVFAGYEPTAYPAVFDAYLRTLVEGVRRGLCSVCGGRVESSLLAGPEGPTLVFDCTRCPEQVQASVAVAARDHPAVVSLLHEAGIDLREAPLWAVDALVDTTVEGDETGATVTVLTDHRAVRVAVGADGRVTGVESVR